MRFCEGVVPCGAALFAFVREAPGIQYHSLGKTKALNSGGPGAEPPLRTGQIRQRVREDQSILQPSSQRVPALRGAHG